MVNGKNIDAIQAALKILGNARVASTKLEVEVIPTDISEINDIVFGCGGIPRGKVIEIYSKAGVGKCLGFQSWVLSKQGLSQLKNLLPENSTEAAFTPISLTLKDITDWVEADRVYTENNVNTLKVSTSYGFELEGDYSHRIKSLTSSGEVIWKSLNDLIVGDSVIISPNHCPEFGEISSFNDLKLARLLGYLIAEGYVKQLRGFSFTNAEDSILSDYIYCLKTIFPDMHYGISLKHNSIAKGIRVSNKKAREFLATKGLGYNLSGTKEVPHWILKGGFDRWKNFLIGYLSGDGGVSYKWHRPVITATSKSPKLIEQIQLILLFLGIISRRGSKLKKMPNNPTDIRKYYYLRISGNNFIKLASLFKWTSNNKQEAIEEALKLKINNNFDNIPCIELLINIRTWVYAKYPHRGFRWLKGLNYLKKINGQSLVRHISSKEAITRVYLVELKDNLTEHFPDCPFIDTLENLVNPNFFYDKIVEKSSGISKVIDFNVPSTHQYIANGFICHNSSFSYWLIGQVQKREGTCVLFDAEGSYYPSYGAAFGIDNDKLILAEFTYGEDCLYQIKQLIALNIVDLIVLDSMPTLQPFIAAESTAEVMKMNIKLARASMYTIFFQDLPAGYTIKDKNGKKILSNKTYIVGDEKVNDVHRISDKKTTLICINHAKNAIGIMYGEREKTPCGEGINFASAIRIGMKYVGKSKKKAPDGGPLFKTVQIKAVKNKLAPPLNITSLKLLREGGLELLDSSKSRDVDLDEIEEVDENKVIPEIDPEENLSLLKGVFR